MKKLVYALILPLVVVSALVVLANRGSKKETSKTQAAKPLSAEEMKREREKWEASPAGLQFKYWEESPAGKKVYASEAKIKKQINAFTDMEAVVTSLSLPAGSRLGFGLMAKINGEDFILTFEPGLNNDLQELRSLKVKDKIIIRGRAVSHAPKYAYPIVSGDYVERDGKIIYQRVPRIGGC